MRTVVVAALLLSVTPAFAAGEAQRSVAAATNKKVSRLQTLVKVLAAVKKAGPNQHIPMMVRSRQTPAGREIHTLGVWDGALRYTKELQTVQMAVKPLGNKGCVTALATPAVPPVVLVNKKVGALSAARLIWTVFAGVEATVPRSPMDFRFIDPSMIE